MRTVQKLWPKCRNQQILDFFTDFMKIQMPIEFEPLKIEQNFLALYLCFKSLAIHLDQEKVYINNGSKVMAKGKNE